VRASGRAVVFAAIIDALTEDTPIITTASFTAVLVLVLLLARGRGAWLIVGSLCVGVVWMAGAVAAAGVHINVLNFIALPITFGIATDYSANVYLRYRQEGPARLPAVIASTGGAVALCSATTIIGYGALLLADNRGLRSFGAAAILGELACLTTALVLMPAVITLVDRRSR
jgi:predicted RND superfamily exporter protein